MIEYTAVIEPGSSIARDCYIGHFTLVRSGVVIGVHSEVRAHCFIAPNVWIGEDVAIMQFSNIGEGTTIFEQVYIGAMCMITNTNRIKHGRDFELIKTPCAIGRAARIASRVTLLPGVVIGENALIGAGSLVTKDIPARQVWMGHPARYVRDVPEEEIL